MNPPITFIEMLEAIYNAVAAAEAATPDNLAESEFAGFLEAEGLALRHQHDPDGMVSVYQGPRVLFRCTPERHRLLAAVIDLEESEYVP
jgi:hypothetical protein